jgi:hypothetical protein
MEPEKFRLYGFFELRKSTAARLSPEEYIIRGRIVDERQDLQGETPNLDWFDWSYFDKHGLFKYEHDPEVVVHTEGEVRVETKPNPDNIIGVPIKRWREGNAMFVEGPVLPGRPMADKVIGLAKAYDEYNKIHPHHERHLQFSVEGGYARRERKSGKVVYGGRVENVVVTPQGQGPTTRAEIQKANQRVFKSLEAGYATSPDSMKGGETLRRESLEGSEDNKPTKTPSKSSPSKGEDMIGKEKAMKFKTHNEACEHFKKSGLNEEEARKKADEYFAKERGEKEEEEKEMEKSLNGQSSVLQKSLDLISRLHETVSEGKEEVQDFQKTLRKSLAMMEVGKDINGAEFLAGQAQAVTATYNMVEKGIVTLAKSLQALTESKIADIAIMSHLNKKINDMQDTHQKTIEGVEVITNALRKSQLGVRTTGLNSLNVDGDGHGDPGEGDKQEKMLKSIGSKSAETYFVNKGASLLGTNPEEAQRYFEAQVLIQKTNGNLMRLPRPLQTELITTFKPTAN